MSSSGIVLGACEMREVYADMARTTVPTWIKRAPRMMGNASHGKLSADQWRVACTVHYLITLIRLWGANQQATKANARFLDILDNFIHLVLATSLASRRSTSSYRQSRVLWHTEKYLAGLRKLYPGTKIQFNNHFSLHIPEFLQLFGPPHSWWAFPFERFNGILQGLATNSIFGELFHPARTFMPIAT